MAGTARVVGGTVGLVGLVLLGGLVYLAYGLSDAPWTLLVLAVVTAPFALLFSMLVLAPRALQRVLRRWAALDVGDSGHVAAAVVMGLALYWVLGAGAAVSGAFALEEVYGPQPARLAPPPEDPAAARPVANATYTAGGVNLTWVPAGGNASANGTFVVYRGLDPAATSRAAQVEGAPAWRDVNVSGGLPYYYRVTEVANGTESAPSDVVEAIVPANPSALYAGLLQNVAIMVLPAILYVSFVHNTGPGGAFRMLGLRAEGSPRALLLGLLAGVGFLLVLGIILAYLAGVLDLPENERATAIGLGLTLGGALFVSAGAALSEEVLFRGFLQPRIGILAQAVLFAAAHVSYVDVLEVVVVFLLAILFALLYRWTGNLWAPIAAHFAFNLVNLVGIVCSEDPAGCLGGF